MKTLKEALISKDKRKWASKGKDRIYIFVPGSGDDYLKISAEYSEFGVVCRDEVEAFILDPKTSKEVNDKLKYRDKSHWYIPKQDQDIESIKNRVYSTDYNSYNWLYYFYEISYTDI